MPIPVRFLVDSSSVSPLRVRWQWTPRSCFSMSHPPRWTRSLWARFYTAQEDGSTCAFVRPIPLALFSTYLSMASPRVTSLCFCRSAGNSSKAPGLARSSSRFSIHAAALEGPVLPQDSLAIASDRDLGEPGDSAVFAFSLDGATHELQHLLQTLPETGRNHNERDRHLNDNSLIENKKISADKASLLSIAPMMDGSDLVGVSVA